MRTWSTIAVVALAWVCWPASLAAQAVTNTITTPSGNLELSFRHTTLTSRDPANPQGWWPVQLKNTVTNRVYNFMKADPWTIDAWNLAKLRHYKHEIFPSAPETTAYNFAISVSANKVIVSWTDLVTTVQAGGTSFNSTSDEIDVVATIEGMSDEKFHFTVTVTYTDTASGSIESTIFGVNYPRLQFGNTTGEEPDPIYSLALPITQGELILNPQFDQRDYVAEALDPTTDRNSSPPLPTDKDPTQAIAFSCPGSFSMQWFGFSEPDNPARGTLVHGTDDSAFHMKLYKFASIATNGTVAPYRRAMVTSLLQTPEDNILPGTTSYTSPYAYLLSHVNGGWYEVAKQYRTWALSQPWIPHGPTGNVLPMYLNGAFSDDVKYAVAFAEDSPDACEISPWVSDQDHFANWDEYHEDRMTFLGLTGKRVFGRVDYWDYNAYGLCEGWWLDAGGAGPLVPDVFTDALEVVTANDPNFATGPYFNFTAYAKHSSGGTDRSDAHWPATYVPALTNGTPYVNDVVLDFVALGPKRLDDPLNPNDTDYKTLMELPTTVFDRFTGCGTSSGPWDRTLYILDVAHPFSREATTYHVSELVGPVPGSWARGLYCDVASVLTLSHGAMNWGNTDDLVQSNSYGQHPIGGGSWMTDALRETFAAARATANSLDSPEFFLGSEGNNEALLDRIEYTHGRWGLRREAVDLDWTWVDSTSSTIVETRPVEYVIAPLFDTVYHDFHRTTLYQQPIYRDDSIFTLDDYDLYWTGRYMWAQSLFLGHPPSIGAAIASGTAYGSGNNHKLTALYNDPIVNNQFKPFADFMADLCKLRARSDVHELVVFGERMKDAPTNAPFVAATFAPFMTPYLINGDVPTVLASAYRRAIAGGPPPTISLAIELLNWTKTSDTATKGHAAGAQTVQVTVNAKSCGLSLSHGYTVTLLYPDGSTTFVPGSYTFASYASTHTFTVTIPELSAVVMRLD